MSKNRFDVIVIGAGAAGLSAWRELTYAGTNVICLEATDRIGGRIHTIHDPLFPVPVELGAEFVHGRPPEIWEEVNNGSLAIVECGEKMIRTESDDSTEDGADVNDPFADMREAAAKGPDRSFQEFLDASSYPEHVKRSAASYVEGFNAAHKEIIGISSLAKDAEAADEIDGDRVFRIVNGYDSLIRQISVGSAALRLNSRVESVEWTPGNAALHIRSQLTGERSSFGARRIVITVPLGVLRSGSIRFYPEPAEALQAAASLAFGQVFRVVLRFRERFWLDDPKFAEAGFILSQQPVFPTWWTARPVEAPVITGWSAGPPADVLLGREKPAIIRSATESLAHITCVSPKHVSELLEGAHVHDWHADPFARGAYSYVPAGAMAAREKLAEPVDSTLFFAGEATELNGHSATVHGAIASGYRAARQVLSSFKTVR